MERAPRPTVPPPGGARPAASWFGRAWTGFRTLPVGGQVVVWVACGPMLAALVLLSAARPAAWRVVGAAGLLLVVTPMWAVAITPGVSVDPEPGREDDADVPAASVAGELEVHFLDVGQGDATLVLHDEVAVLIDTGPWQASNLVPMLQARGVEALDLVVVTHPHADHLGQFDQVLEAFPVDEVWWSGSVTTSQTFERAITALERSDAAYAEPRVGDATTIGPLAIDIVNPPNGVGRSDLHDAGLGLRVGYGDVRFLFTGDAEAATERRMASTTASLVDAEILQLGHHGSRTSTTATFLSAVDPELAIYSASSSNQYGHPHVEVLDRVLAADIDLYGTDVHGSIVVTTDGATWSVATEVAGDVAVAATSAPAITAGAPSDAGPDHLRCFRQRGSARLDEVLAQGVACDG